MDTKDPESKQSLDKFNDVDVIIVIFTYYDIYLRLTKL